MENTLVFLSLQNAKECKFDQLSHRVSPVPTLVPIQTLECTPKDTDLRHDSYKYYAPQDSLSLRQYVTSEKHF